jgi:hypothetical protein
MWKSDPFQVCTEIHLERLFIKVKEALSSLGINGEP